MSARRALTHRSGAPQDNRGGTIDRIDAIVEGIRVTAEQRGRFDGEGVTGHLQWWHRAAITAVAVLLLAVMVGVAVGAVALVMLVVAAAGREAWL